MTAWTWTIPWDAMVGVAVVLALAILVAGAIGLLAAVSGGES